MNRFLKNLPAMALLTLVSCSSKPGAQAQEEPGLKDAFEGKFLIGAALNASQIDGSDSIGQLTAVRNFNSIVAENVMKCEAIHPEKDRYFWDDADAFVKFGEENDMHIVGHCLIWHSQCAPWFHVDDKGEYVSADTLKERMRDHIHTIVGRYKGRVKGWDVVNEAIMEDGSYRKTDFYKILGEEFIPLALQYAHEADPEAELYLNDYGMNVPGRRDAYVKLVRDLKKRGLRVDAIGMQGHMGMDYPEFSEFEAAIDSFANTGCKVMITEWDMSALPTAHMGANVSDTVAFNKAMNPYTDQLPDSVSSKWNKRMGDVMDILIRHSDDITRVTVWGVSDGGSWRNDFPVKGRKDYPTFFDRDHKMKPFLRKYMTEKQEK